MPTVSCLYCKLEFHEVDSRIASGRGKYCSRACRKAANTVAAICNFCEKPFTLYAHRALNERGRYCSKQCFNDARKDRIAFTCDYCGKLVSRRRSQVRMDAGRYCGLPCYYRDTKKPIAERFWEKVNQNTCLGKICGCHKGLGHCWPWIGYRDKKGYGRLNNWVNGENQPVLANRLSYELAHGPLLPGFFACHKCDNPPCCNDAHLFPGTNQENMLDASLKGRLVNRKRPTPGLKRLRKRLPAAMNSRHS